MPVGKLIGEGLQQGMKYLDELMDIGKKVDIPPSPMAKEAPIQTVTPPKPAPKPIVEDEIPPGLDDLISDVQKTELPPPKPTAKYTDTPTEAGTTEMHAWEGAAHAEPVRYKGRSKALKNNPVANQFLGDAYEYMRKHGPTHKGFGRYTGPDGVTYNIKGARSLESVYNKFMETGNKTGLKMQDVKRTRADGVSSDEIRKINAARETYKGSETEFYKHDRLPQPEGAKAHSAHFKEPHHIRGVQQLEPFFEAGPNFNDADAAELARFAAEDLMMPTGNTKLNRADIAHLAHKGATGEGKGYHVWESRYKKGRLNPKVKKKFYHIPKSANLEQRKELLRQYLLTEQEAMNQALFIEQMAYQNPDNEYWQKLVEQLRAQELELGAGFDSGPSGKQVTPKPLLKKPKRPKKGK